MAEIPLLELENLHIVRRSSQGAWETLVHIPSLRLERGGSLGLVGASGSGKSLTALALMNLLPEPELQVQGGAVRFQGRELAQLSSRAMNELRGSRMALIVQDALAAFNPVRRIEAQMDEVFRFHRRKESKPERNQRIRFCLERAGLGDVKAILRAFPHELSGGMRQRVLLAMALLLQPELLIADEPTTALDVTLQAAWVREVRTLQREQKLGLLFISHDLGLVAELCDRVAVLHKGRLVEIAETGKLMQRPRHPYTKAMLAALPRAGHRSQLVNGRRRDQPDSKGCPYADQCSEVRPICLQEQPTLSGSPDHAVACHALKT